MELNSHEKELNEAYIQVIHDQRNQTAISLMKAAQISGKKIYDEKNKGCIYGLRQILGDVNEKNKIRYKICQAKAQAAGARHTASIIEKELSKCGPDKDCKNTLKRYANTLRKYAKSETSSANKLELNLVKMGAVLRKKK